ncbi:VOC family protein, partial [Parafrankia sp. FMc2]|uniref:VOC family protein n=1 Tax=Parafrankia sp. FMc2 TaxID=3233196 RepID=UPI0034D45008
MPRTVPRLWFDTEGEEAARFYVSVFPNSAITAVTRHGPGAHRPEGLARTVAFTLDGREYTVLNGGPEFTFSAAVSFQILCSSAPTRPRSMSPPSNAPRTAASSTAAGSTAVGGRGG